MWNENDSAKLYGVPRWGRGLFQVNGLGHVEVCPPGAPHPIDLKKLVDDLVARGVSAPVLVRLTDVLNARIGQLAESFRTAIREAEYSGVYRGVYPIKVNQQRHIVQDIVRASRPFHLGLEAGSKPELLLVLAMLDDPEAPIVCNGYKDASYIELALQGRAIGRQTIIVIERPHEIDTILEVAARTGIEPVLGIRAKLSAQGIGRWKTSAGDGAKFGLTVSEIVALCHRLKALGKLHWIRLLHYHIGSQIGAIWNIGEALNEAARIYCELHKMGAPMGWLDVGGGLGVDYDGSAEDSETSMNYDLGEYASTVVNTVARVCDATGVDHPNLITESGRATVAHMSVLLTPVLDVSRRRMDPPKGAATSPYDAVRELAELAEGINRDNARSVLHHADGIKTRTLRRFTMGLCGLDERAQMSEMHWHIAGEVRDAFDGRNLPQEVQDLDRRLADTYYCNFSVFQSAPDSWAIDQLFPVMPIHRLGEEPTERAVLADLTCDSDGKIDKFIGGESVVDLHKPNGRPYYLGIFLVGAYQEILGDLHNLFGDTNAVHVAAYPNARGYRVEHLIEGDTISEVVHYVQYDRDRLLKRLRLAVESAWDDDQITLTMGRDFLKAAEKALDGYTYLD